MTEYYLYTRGQEKQQELLAEAENNRNQAILTRELKNRRSFKRLMAVTVRLAAAALLRLAAQVDCCSRPLSGTVAPGV